MDNNIAIYISLISVVVAALAFSLNLWKEFFTNSSISKFNVIAVDKVTFVDDQIEYVNTPFNGYYLKIIFQITNPKHHPITIFNIFVLDKDKNKYSYLTQHGLKKLQLDYDNIFDYEDFEGAIIRMRCPTSNYHEIPPNSHNRMELFIDAKELIHTKPEKLIVHFRSTTPTILWHPIIPVRKKNRIQPMIRQKYYKTRIKIPKTFYEYFEKMLCQEELNNPITND